MGSRDKILKRVQENQPLQGGELQAFESMPPNFPDAVEKFKEVLIAIGGAVFEIHGAEEINACISDLFPDRKNEVIYLPKQAEYQPNPDSLRKDYASIDLAVLKGEFAVAENAAVWMTEKNMPDRSLPFICERLVLVIDGAEIVPTLRQAYEKIKNTEYQFGTFIAGPSKTADIEQSLVLGAQGPKTLTVFLVNSKV